MTHDQYEESCGEYAWVDGQTYTSTTLGEHTWTYPGASAQGCDSIVTLHLTIEQPFFDTTYQTSCRYYEWFGDTYTQPGYHDYIVSGPICDSTFVLYLDIVDQYVDTIDKTACFNYDWNNVTYTESGSYTDTLSSLQGCDSIVTLNLTIIEPDIRILGYQNIYYSSDIWHGIYHYFVVDSVTIPLAPIEWQCSNPDWILLRVSDYQCKLIATSEGQSVLTAHTLVADNCDEIMSIEITAREYFKEEDKEVMLFPNPAWSNVTVTAPDLLHVAMINLVGQKVRDVSVNASDMVVIDTENLIRGVYLVEITTVNEVYYKRLMLY